MVKIRSAEWLVLVAIVASTAAVQMRERFAGPVVHRHAGFDEQSACGAAHGGMFPTRPVRCETAPGDHVGPDIDQPRAMSRHDTGLYARPRALWV